MLDTEYLAHDMHLRNVTLLSAEKVEEVILKHPHCCFIQSQLNVFDISCSSCLPSCLRVR